MSKTTPNSPAALHREPKPQLTSQPPAALRRRGILSASESAGRDQRLRAGDALWRFYGGELVRAFYR